MDADSIYHIHFDCRFKTKKEVYAFISEIACQDDLSQKAEVENLLYRRDQAGSNLIAEHILLPHIETSRIEKSIIVLIRLAEPIQSWDSQAEDIRLLIAILLKENEEAEIKQRIASFTRTLADELYLSRLLHADEKEEFDNQIIRF